MFDLLIAEERQDEKRAVERDTGLYISDLVYDANPRPLVLQLSRVEEKTGRVNCSFFSRDVLEGNCSSAIINPMPF